MDFNDMPEEGNEDETTSVPDSSPGDTFWKSQFSGEGIDSHKMDLAKIVLSDYCNEDQLKEINKPLDSQGLTLGHSKILVDKFAVVGKRLLANKEERERSDAHKFYGDSMKDVIYNSVVSTGQDLVARAIEEAKNEIIQKGRRSIPGSLKK